MNIKCSGCKKDKDEKEFYKSKTTPSGRQYRCKNCNRESADKINKTKRREKNDFFKMIFG